jgi:hypothetical protein
VHPQRGNAVLWPISASHKTTTGGDTPLQTRHQPIRHTRAQTVVAATEAYHAQPLVPTCALYSRDDGCCEELLLLLELPTAVPRLEAGSACCCDDTAWLCLPLIFRRISLLLFFSPDGDTLRGSSVGLQRAHTARLHVSPQPHHTEQDADGNSSSRKTAVSSPRAGDSNVMAKDCRGLLQLPKLF